MILFFLFASGCIVGSFLNVCIYRLPLGKSVVTPPSACPSCGRRIRPYDNIPLVSYALLGGRCRGCRDPIPARYPIVEALSGALFVLFYTQFGVTLKAGVFLCLSLALLVQAWIDLDHQIIPDEITLPGMLIGVLLASFFPGLLGETVWHRGLLMSLIGLLAGGGSLYLAGTVAQFFLKKEAMGGGDVKLLAMIGTFLGWKCVVWTVFVSSLLGSIVGIYLRLRHGQREIPFGPYLGLAAFAFMFVGAPAVDWYLRTIGFGGAF